MMNSHSAPLIVTRNSSIVTLKVQNDSKQNEASCHDECPIPFSCPHCDKKFTKKGPLKVQNNNHENEASPPKWSIISWWTPIQLLPLWQEIHQKRRPEGAKWQKNQPTWSYMKKSTTGITLSDVPNVTTNVTNQPVWRDMNKSAPGITPYSCSYCDNKCYNDSIWSVFLEPNFILEPN